VAPALAAPRGSKAASPAKWVLQPVPNPSGSVETYLTGVSCASRAFCVAVGSSQSSAGSSSQPLSEVRHQGKWSIQPVPLPSGSVGGLLTRVSCTPSGFCFAVGAFYSSMGYAATLAEEWNGSGWTIEPTSNPAQAENTSLGGVSCTSARACTAVGGAQLIPIQMHPGSATFVERWNGSTWSVQQAPALSPNLLEAVSCPAERDCSAVTTSGPLAGQWNGSTWSAQTMADASGTPTDISCTAADACTLVGYDDSNYPVSTPVAERWNGSSWVSQTPLNPPNPGGIGSRLLGVSCASARICTAVGYSHRTLVEVWNGGTWSVQPNPNPNDSLGQLNAVSCTRSGPCLAVGTYGASEGDLPLVELRLAGDTRASLRRRSP
jgi:hypothetical protein